LLGACSSFPSGATVFLLLVIFTALTLGIYSPLPLVKYLFALHFPFLAIFRQWYHFFPMVNFCLSLLAAMGFAIFAKALSKKNKSIATYLLGFVFFLQALDLANYDRKYFYTFKKAQAAQEIKETLYTQWLLPPANLLTYKERFRLSYFYPEVIPPLPLLTNDREDIAAALERGWVLRRFSAEGKKAAFGVSQYTGPGSINSVGLSLDTEAAASAMLLVPLNYGLGVKAYIDGSQTKTLKVNSALTGILVGEGRHRIEFRIAPDWYKPILWLQVFFYLLLVVFFIRNRRLLTSHSSD
jgi:uncharacterized membrane protein YfhO